MNTISRRTSPEKSKFTQVAKSNEAIEFESMKYKGMDEGNEWTDMKIQSSKTTDHAVELQISTRKTRRPTPPYPETPDAQ